MTYYTGPKTLRNKLNEWFAKQNHIKLPKNAISKLYVSVAEAWAPANLFPTGTEQGLFLDFADASSLYLTNKFQTNVSAYGDPVGGVLDKSQGLVLGAEKLTNGGFDTDLTGWTAAAGFSVSGGKLIGATSGDKIYQAAGITAGEVYSFTITGVVGEWGVRLGQDAANDYTITADGTYFITPGTLYSTTDFRLRVNIAGSELASISVKKLSGNHLIQATSTARPIWTRHPKSGVRNLLDASEDASIFQFNSGNTITTDTDISPVGTLTADTITPSGNSWVRKAISIPADGETYTGSIYLKKRVATGTCRVQLLTETGGTVVSQNIDVNLSTGAVTGGSAEDVGDYYRISGQITNNSANTSFKFFVFPDTSGSLAPVVCWGWSIELGSSATAYQTRVSQYNVTEAGSDDCYGLTFDGVDDYMVTAANLDLSGTSEVTLTAGGYKATDAAGNKTLAVLGAIANGSGRFAMESPPDTGQYAFNAFYASNRTAKVTSGYAAPINTVTTGQASLSSVSLRLDGTQVAADATPNTGSFSSELFNIGRRGNNTSWYAGTIYGVTLTDYTLDAEQLAALETWTAARTPEVTLA